ncbi:MAG TPA: protein-glutamate O-methyltransferase [Deltaproteobacteria bacterium]|nr:protein-glutamate O-methyltransferase [Deltaproteobacteria bacterium]HPR53505.1 protein-glutamate O-methyltransferase [Deltaproteobacteria bacterium]HXK46158.1 protein-glutamate O-methyltransferase [Deltaproteobacteria bacterium]
MNSTLCAQSYSISDKEFQLFREIIYRETGIHMSDRKRNLVVARLSKRLRFLNLKNFSEYYQYLKESSDAGNEIINLINRVTTNKTDFFREKHHFEFLHDEVLPTLIEVARKGRERRLRIWSAGCSSGEEPYSIAMTVSDALREERGWDIKILATDLDTEILSKAARGVYSSQQIAPVPVNYITKYLVRTVEGYEASKEIKNMITFRKLNLMDRLFPMKRSFDVIFCRNVMIYFNEETKSDLVQKFHLHLKDMGLMFIGHSESLMSMKHLFKFLKHTVYQKV